MKTALELARELGHEEVVIVNDPRSGLVAVIALHDTTLGPAVGGTRMRPYPSLEEATTDALRLSRAMTFKAAMAEVARGGGKGVIVGDPARDKSRPLLAAYARVVDRLGGRFHTGGDMGIDARDIAVMARMTKHMSHTAPHAPGAASGSPSSEPPAASTTDLTALGVLEAMRAAASALALDLPGLHVAVQGLGQVGSRLCRLLAAEGARLTVSDVDEGRAERMVAELGAARIDPDSIYDLEADVFSPNAAGGVVNDATLKRLRCRAVVGAANEQLADPGYGDALHRQGVLYGPDYVVNAGGLLSLLYEIGETDLPGVIARVKAIGPRVADLWARARREDVPPHRLADRIVEERLAAARAARGRG